MKRIFALAGAGLLTATFVGTAVSQSPIGRPSVFEGAVAQESKKAEPSPAPAPAATPAPAAQPAPAGNGCCQSGCGNCCKIDCLKPWSCEDLQMKPAAPCNPCHTFLWCAKEEEKKNGNGNGAAEAPKGPETPLMQAIHCWTPGLYQHLDCHGTKIYGWMQQGYTANFDSPNDRNNFGVNFNNRSNEYRLNQLNFRAENALERDGQANFGYTVDFLVGHDAPLIAAVSPGLFDNFTGGDLDHIGIELPQFFAEYHLPGFITEKGMDIRVGRFYTLHGNELTPAINTNFYSHSYGYFYAWPFSHTGVMSILHLTDTIDIYNGVVLGWDNVFDDNNDKLSYHGQVLWTACDKRSSAWVAYTLGEEQANNDDFRILLTYDYSRKFGCHDEWQLVLHGGNAWDESSGGDVEWYDYAVNLFYTINPKLILGGRAEYFRDDDGVRTGFADSFYELTAGVTYKPFQNLWVRPELRFDWADNTRPFNDGTGRDQVTAAIDVVWQF